MSYTADMFEIQATSMYGPQIWCCKEHGIWVTVRYHDVSPADFDNDRVLVCMSYRYAKQWFDKWDKENKMLTGNSYWQVFGLDQDESHVPALERKNENAVYPERVITRLQPATGWFELQEHAGLGFDECWNDDSYPLHKMTDKELSNKFPRSLRHTWMYDMEPYGRMRLCADYDDRFQYHGSYSDVWDCNGERICVSYNGRTIQGVHLDDIERRMEIANLSPYGGWNL